MICVDASLVVAWLLPEELSGEAIRLRDRLRALGENFVAPSLIVYEVSSTLRRAIYRKRVPFEFANDALEAFKYFPIQARDPASLLDTAWTWGQTLNAPRLYDMYYLALAETEQCDLWTADRRFARLVGGKSSRVHWVGDSEPI